MLSNVPVSFLRQYALVVTVNLCMFTTGMSLAWPSPMLVKLNDPEETPLSTPITVNEGSWVVSVGFLCAPPICFFGGKLLDHIGRRYCVLLIFVPKIITGFLYIFASEVWMLVAGRTLTGVADLFSFIMTPTYVSEIASIEYRSTLFTLTPLLSGLGELVSYSIGPYISYKTFNIIFTSIIAVTFVPNLLFLPDSPSFLYSKGQEEEALKLLIYLRASVVKAREEMNEYKFITNTPKETVNKIALFKDRIFRKSLALGCLLGMGSQLSGFNAVTFYLQTILISTNTNVSSETSSVIVGVIQVIASLVSHSVMSSRFGRKTILYFSFGGMGIGMFGLGLFFKISEPKDYIITGIFNYLPLISFVIVIICFMSGIGALLGGVVGELYEDRARAFGISITLSLAVLVTFITSKYFPSMISTIGPAATYWMFGVLNIILIITVALFLPETKDKSFAEIQTALGRKCET